MILLTSKIKEMGKSKSAIIEAYLKRGASLRETAISLTGDIERAADAISNSFRNGGRLYAFGNGGSAADAQHIVAEFTGRFRVDRDPLPAEALTTNSSTLTAIANDYAFEEIFARQVKALARSGDVVVGISTSGGSKNVLRGLEAAKQSHAKTIGLCGQKGQMKLYCDILLSVPSDETSLIQEMHISIGHLLCLLVEEDLFE
jgi:D-sedoheptulose 7-phosphate isomerase